MLTLMRARIEAARAICLTTGVQSDLARLAPTEAERSAARARQELLTPIAKAWSTDMGVEVASMGVQIHGGMGFIEETVAAQHYRDARIAPIYEGTNGIQAMDLAGRKLGMRDGGVMLDICSEISGTVSALKGSPGLDGVANRLEAALGALERATHWMLAHKGPDALSGATAYLKLAGDVIGGDMLARQALATATGDDDWSKSEGALARIYASQVLTLASGLADAVTEGGADLEFLSAEMLAD